MLWLKGAEWEKELFPSILTFWGKDAPLPTTAALKMERQLICHSGMDASETQKDPGSADHISPHRNIPTGALRSPRPPKIRLQNHNLRLIVREARLPRCARIRADLRKRVKLRKRSPAEQHGIAKKKKTEKKPWYGPFHASKGGVGDYITVFFVAFSVEVINHLGYYRGLFETRGEF